MDPYDGICLTPRGGIRRSFQGCWTRAFLLELGDLPHGGIKTAMAFEGLALLVLGRYSQRAEPAACEEGGRLVALIWHGVALGDPLVSLTVTRATGDALPLLEVRLVAVADPRARVSPEIVGALGDLERCLAWSWL